MGNEDTDKAAQNQDVLDKKPKALANLKGAAKSPGAVSETNAVGSARESKKNTTHRDVLRVIQPTNVEGPARVEEPAASSAVPNRLSLQTHHRDDDSRLLKPAATKKGLRYILPSNAPSGIAVATEVVDSLEETERMATQIADIQAKLQEHETRDIVHGTPVTITQEAADGQRDENRSVHRYLRILFILLMVGGIVVLILTLKKKPTPSLPSSTSEEIATTSSPSLVASTSMSRSPAPTPTHTSALTANPTQASSMPSLPPSWTSQPTTDAPSATPTLSRRSYLLEALMPSVSTTSGVFDTIEDWETYLIANPDTPQSEAFGWLSNVDEYSARPQTMSVAELQERYALLVLYFATSGPSEWSLWDDYFPNVAVSVCQWNAQMYGSKEANEGVFCEQSTGLVKDLLLWSARLSGSLPSEISLLQNLETLDLSSNDLNGSLPTHLGYLSHLKALWLDGNDFIGSLPPISALSSISVSIGSNDLSGTLPSDWGRTISSLIEFNADSNDLRGTIPSEWVNFTQLEIFSCRWNGVNGKIPTTLGSMTRLTELDFYANELTGPLPSEVGLMTSLIWVELGGNDLTGSLPSEIGNLVNIQELYLGFNPGITGTVPAEFENMGRFPRVYLHDTSLTGSLDSIFCDRANGPSYLVADCHLEIECSCCDSCYDCSIDSC